MALKHYLKLLKEELKEELDNLATQPYHQILIGSIIALTSVTTTFVIFFNLSLWFVPFIVGLFLIIEHRVVWGRWIDWDKAKNILEHEKIGRWLVYIGSAGIAYWLYKKKKEHL